MFFNLPPSHAGPEDQMLLPAHGDYGHLRAVKQQLAHPPLVSLAKRNPLAAGDKVGVVAHALRLVLARAPGQGLAVVVKAEEAGPADDLAGEEFVMIGEGVLDPALE